MEYTIPISDDFRGCDCHAGQIADEDEIGKLVADIKTPSLIG